MIFRILLASVASALPAVLDAGLHPGDQPGFSEKPVAYPEAHDLLCLDLLKYFDLPALRELAGPAAGEADRPGPERGR